MATEVEFIDKRFRELVSGDATIHHLATGFLFTEGPVWIGDSVLFSDIPNRRIVRYQSMDEGPSLSTFRHESRSNGLTLDRQGHLIACEYGDRAISLTNIFTKEKRILVDRYDGKKLNGPNDVIVKSDGSIYFTDPIAGLRFVDDSTAVDPSIIETKRELDFEGVFRLSPDGTILDRLNAVGLARPNGLAFSPDESVIYMVDNGGANIRWYTILTDGDLSGGEVFAQPQDASPGAVDGIKVDAYGNLYTTGPGGLWVYAPDGVLLGRIRPPEPPANFAWGDSDWKSLYMTARTSLYKIRMNVPGIAVGQGNHRDN
jgi:gluconolactonase